MDNNKSSNKKERIFLGLGIFFLIGTFAMLTEDILGSIFYAVLAVLFIILGRKAIPTYLDKLKSCKFALKTKNVNKKILNSVEPPTAEMDIERTPDASYDISMGKPKYKKQLKLKVPILAGLNVPENTVCTIYLCDKCFNFIVNGVTFSLDFNKITDVSFKTNKEIQQQYVSSAGGAIAGAALLGPLGALIGGRNKRKTTRKITQCLIFTYLKDENISYLAFDVSNSFKIGKAKKIRKFFKSNKMGNSEEITFKL